MWEAARHHLKLRFCEWIVGLGLLVWGAITLSRPGYFLTTPALANMTELASQNMWGWAAVSIGLLRMLFLFINGTWRRSAHLRATGSALSAIFWAAVFGSYLTLGNVIPNLATIGILLSLDMYSLWFASEDAKRSDILTNEDGALLKEFKRRTHDSP
jgi:hypothetical protein